MASLTLNLSIGDWLSPIKSVFKDTFTKETRENAIQIFDRICLRVIAVIILLATTVLTVMSIPYAIMVIEDLITLFGHFFIQFQKHPTRVMPFIHFITLMPFLLFLID